MIRDDLYISRCKVANQLFYHKRDKFYRKFYFHESILLLLHVDIIRKRLCNYVISSFNMADKVRHSNTTICFISNFDQTSNKTLIYKLVLKLYSSPAKSLICIRDIQLIVPVTTYFPEITSPTRPVFCLIPFDKNTFNLRLEKKMTNKKAFAFVVCCFFNFHLGLAKVKYFGFMFLCRRALFRGDKTGLSASKVRVFYAEKKGRNVS